MYDGRLAFVKVFESAYDLDNDRARLALRNNSVLLEVKVEVVARTILHHCAEPTSTKNRHEQVDGVRPS